MTAFREWDQEVQDYEPPKDGQTTDREKLPPGEYQLIVEEVKYIETKKGPALVWKFIVPAGHQLEGHHHEHFMGLFTVQNRNYAFNDLLKCGLQVKNWTQALANLKKLEGRVVAVRIFIKDGFTNMFFNALVGEVSDSDIPF